MKINNEKKSSTFQTIEFSSDISKYTFTANKMYTDSKNTVIFLNCRMNGTFVSVPLRREMKTAFIEKYTDGEVKNGDEIYLVGTAYGTVTSETKVGNDGKQHTNYKLELAEDRDVPNGEKVLTLREPIQSYSFD